MTDDVWRARDAAGVATVLLNGAFCIRCLMMRTDLSEADVKPLVGGAPPYVHVTTNTERCDGCGRVKMTYRLG